MVDRISCFFPIPRLPGPVASIWTSPKSPPSVKVSTVWDFRHSGSRGLKSVRRLECSTKLDQCLFSRLYAIPLMPAPRNTRKASSVTLESGGRDYVLSLMVPFGSPFVSHGLVSLFMQHAILPQSSRSGTFLLPRISWSLPVR